MAIRTSLGSQRYNKRMDKIMEYARNHPSSVSSCAICGSPLKWHKDVVICSNKKCELGKIGAGWK